MFLWYLVRTLEERELKALEDVQWEEGCLGQNGGKAKAVRQWIGSMHGREECAHLFPLPDTLVVVGDEQVGGWRWRGVLWATSYLIR